MTSPLFTRAVETMQPQESFETVNGVPLFTLHQPMPNQEKCQGCHGTESRVRAVVRVATSMEPVFAEVRKQRNRQILVGVLTIVAAAGVLAVAMRLVVVRPFTSWPGSRAASVRAISRRARPRSLGRRGRRAGRRAQRHDDASRARPAGAGRAQHGAGHRPREPPGVAAALELLEQLKGELSKFVPDAVKELLERDPSATTLEKRTEEVSVLFLDITGYTRLSEQLASQAAQPARADLLLELPRDHPRAARRRERDGGRRAHGDLPAVERGAAGARATRTTR